MHFIPGASEFHRPQAPERLVNAEGSLSDIIAQSHEQPTYSHPDLDDPADKSNGGPYPSIILLRSVDSVAPACASRHGRGQGSRAPLILGDARVEVPAKRPAGQAKAPPAKKQKTVASKKKTPRFSFMLPSSTTATIKTDLVNIIQVAGKHLSGLLTHGAASAVGTTRRFIPTCICSAGQHTSVTTRCTTSPPSTRHRRRRTSIAKQRPPLADVARWKAAKHAANIPDSNGPPPEDLSVLLAKERARYDRGLARAQVCKAFIAKINYPLQIDEDGYASIFELLEPALLLDLSRNQPNRLSDRALARTKLDVAS
ncbi:unnamed protein product [Phytophthora fragariaefolia]|uniref:Unnamed protein product n=1 Tax=Phytophthora fragariaefolia TaxID=1490495 RepID=A0A9W6YML0_9STRA|nr:unnamed protein product [Phytophthora fragariaefolia]